MGVFRADKEDGDDNINNLEEKTAAEEPVNKLDDIAEDAERDQLNDQARQFESGQLQNADTPYAQPERQALDRLQPQPPEEPEDSFAERNLAATSSPRGQTGSSPGSKLGSFIKRRQVAAGLGFLLVPTLVGLLLLIFAVQAGLALEHITRVTTGLRFGSMHYQLNRRFNHLRGEYIRLGTYPGGSVSQVAPYARTTLASRLLGVHPNKIVSTLRNEGWDLHFSYREGHTSTTGRWTLTQAIDPDGNPRTIKNTREALNFLRQSKSAFDNNDLGRFRAARSSLLLAKQIGIPFLRFRVIIDELGGGGLRNAIRGSPSNLLEQRLTESMFNDKNRLLGKLPLIGRTLERFKADELVEPAQKDITKNVDSDTRLGKLRSFFDGRQSALKVAAVGSIAVATLSIACVIRELGVMIRDAFKMKVRGMQDSAATLMTTTSQIKAGDIEGEVVGDMTRRFEGFELSASYQVGVQQRAAQSVAGVEGSDFSRELSPEDVFDGWSTRSIAKFGDLLNPANLVLSAVDYLKANAGVLEGIVAGIQNIVGAPISAAAKAVETAFRETCEKVLDAKVQIGLFVTEVVAVIIGTIMTGGLVGGARLTAGQVVNQVLRTLATSYVIGAVAGVALDALLFDYLLPNVVLSASGADTILTAPEANLSGLVGGQASGSLAGQLLNTGEALAGGGISQRASNGARNYALVDYGMHYLSTGEALANGGSRLATEDALAQTQEFIAFQKQRYAEEGLISNITSLDNPYSLASSWVVAQSTPGGWSQKTQHYFAGLLGRLGTTFDIFQPASAQIDDTAITQEILYPGQDWVIGFNQPETSGEDPLFAHETNTVYVEENIEFLQEEYSSCLGLDTAEFLLDQMDTSSDEYGREYYPAKCDQEEARRYKTYYQDCALIENIRLWESNHSPMFSSRCDHLLSSSNQEFLKAASLELEEEFSFFNRGELKLSGFSFAGTWRNRRCLFSGRWRNRPATRSEK